MDSKKPLQCDAIIKSIKQDLDGIVFNSSQEKDTKGYALLLENRLRFVREALLRRDYESALKHAKNYLNIYLDNAKYGIDPNDQLDAVREKTKELIRTLGPPEYISDWKERLP